MHESATQAPASAGRSSFQAALLTLLVQLERLDEHYGELSDTAARDELFRSVWESVLVPGQRPYLPRGAVYSARGNILVRKAFADFVASANAALAEAGLVSFQQRLAAFQDDHVSTPSGSGHATYFGVADPAEYDPRGKRWPQY